MQLLTGNTGRIIEKGKRSVGSTRWIKLVKAVWVISLIYKGVVIHRQGDLLF
jgi:hypothetical protein